MAEHNTITPENKYRSTMGTLKVLSKENKFLYRVELWLLNSEVCRNNWKYLNLEEHVPAFINTPILVAYVHGGTKIGDGHNFKKKRNKDGKEYASFTDSTAERIVGWFSDSDNIRIENKDGTDWIVASGNIWAWYAAELTEMLSEQGADGMEVSIETLIAEMHMDGDTEVYTKYEILGTTILGRGVTPAIAGAHIRTLSIDNELNKLKLRVASYHEKQNNKKRSAKRMSKALIGSLQERFTGYKVLAASDDGMHVCLLSENGTPFTYSFASEKEKTIAPEKFKEVSVNATFVINDELEITVDAADMAETAYANCARMSKDLKAANDSLEAVNKKLAEAEGRECAWRVRACKDSIKKAFEAFNADQPDGEKIDVKICESVEARADSGDYTACVDKDGKWNGDEKACADLMASCAAEVQKINRARTNAIKEAEAKKSNTFIWDKFKNNDSSPQGGIAAMLERGSKKITK